MALPKTLGTCADKLYQMNQDLAALKRKHEAEQKKYKDKIRELEEHALGLMNAQKIGETKGVAGRLKREIKDVANVPDWSKFFEYAKAHDAPDLYQRRINSKAVFDRLEAGEKVPVKVEHLTVLKVLKA